MGLLSFTLPELEAEVTSPSVKRAIREFIDVEENKRRIAYEEDRARRREDRHAEFEKIRLRLQHWSMGNVPSSVAKDLVRASAWWLTHSSGRPVRAPRHASRVEKYSLGWGIEFGANHFLITRAVQRSATKLLEYVPGIEERHEMFRMAGVLNILRPAFPASVANYKLDEYGHYAPTKGHLVFGAQSICVDDAARYVLGASGLMRHTWAE